MLLRKGNTKLGSRIWHFSVPNVHTCPGRTETCESVCYVTRYVKRFSRIELMYQDNYRASLRPDFPDRIIDEIRERKVRILRIHVSGDFYSVEYLDKWLKVVQSCKDTVFVAFTRSWRLPEFLPSLEEFSKSNNTQLWLSFDRDCRQVPRIEGARLAYLSISPEDYDDNADLTFVNWKAKQKRLGSSLICPYEQGLGLKIKCDKCMICFSDYRIKKHVQNQSHCDTAHRSDSSGVDLVELALPTAS